MLLNLWQKYSQFFLHCINEHIRYNELKKTNHKNANTKLLDNVIYFLRCMCQSPKVKYIALEPSHFTIHVTDIFSEFLALIENSFNNDMTFLTSGPSARIKTSVNYCVIVQRLSEGLLSKSTDPMYEYITKARGNETARFSSILAQKKNEQNEVPSLLWKRSTRKNVILAIKEWYSIAQEVSTVMVSSSSESAKMAKYRSRLLQKVCSAAEKLFRLGNIFENESVPQDVILWMAKIEMNGFRLFTPDLLSSSENALGTVLANSYG